MHSSINKLFLLFFLLAIFSDVIGFYEKPSEHRHMNEHTPYRVLGIGSAIMDFSIPVNEDFFSHVPGEKGGALPIEIEEFDKLLSKSSLLPHIATGGSCANTLKGLANLGEKCAFLSLVGSDSHGKHFVRYMQKLGIVALLSEAPKPTARVLCLITPDGQRTMRFYSGCCQEMSSDIFHPAHFKNIALMHIDAYTFRNGDMVEKSMKLAKKADAKISMDLSCFEIVSQFHESLMKLLPRYVDIVFANEDETKALTGLPPHEGCFKLQEMCPIAVVLIGSQGCLIGHQGKVTHIPGFPAKVIDSTGCGDLFASGFLHGYLQGYSLERCGRIGNRLGSVMNEVQGTEFADEKWKEILALIQQDQEKVEKEKVKKMFAVIYRGYIKPGFETQYQNYWKIVASYFVEKRGALGSTLHKTKEGMWIAYSKWPDQATRDASWPQNKDQINTEIPPEICEAIQGLKECLTEQLPEICMEVVEEIF